ncbi:alkyl sulfatase dimerization domain-containing protein [Parvibaculum sp.]|uniref:alkyl sulfatase dimerization domain-containing protein n=1 Tax=Parvibaculum sp. TaxID=2024848 RepID=UPI00271A6741|nr:alkyl sulfatase dimerization domain-containing protein [Parvibaculum sp.]MDO9127711.1 alkyl sulfatase dimerization domain-containing protein [Parvibaculum sp.]MDP1626359.1 alkyl sulfatase dimerization domain-containing protein [Parvibaculum sp.]MDP2151250.1 alkyl sulfatase dimerization domain-containing protein [Parvibaculum sp.]MDP3327091.1 alkyl sulfatase dimerization domain-containing protein [Parvibaculum sp.]
MADLLALSARYIDNDIYEGAGLVNRPTTELSEVAPGIALIEAFSHVVAFRTGDGLVLFDTSLEAFAGGVMKSLRGWTDEPVSHVCYTHGHADHVGGTGAVLCEACDRNRPRPQVIGHENVSPRFRRYELTNGYNFTINARQFAPATELRMGGGEPGGKPAARRFGPDPWVQPDTTFRDRMEFRAGDTRFELRHAIGETDDHLWAWVPEHKAICSGDFVTWVFPNAGNPQKVQRFPLEWARALREMAAMEPELLLPAHGLPIAGKARIAGVLDTIASALEFLVSRSLDMMNAGARLDDLIHGVKLPSHFMDKPYLKPVYDEPEFIIHNIWRLYGGWYDGNPSRLKPAPDAAVAAEIAALAGGVAKLVARAETLAATGREEDMRLACHLAEAATLAEPENREAHAARAAVYGARRKAELSLMSKGIFGWAERESAQKAGKNDV